MPVVPAVCAISRRGADQISRGIAIRALVVAIVLAITAVTSEASDWQPVTLVLALMAAHAVAEAATVAASGIRISAGLLTQTTIMAVLGPGPAVAAAFVGTFVDSR